MQKLPQNLVLIVAAAINDPVTTTDELIPSGETSSYRSNPQRLSEFALARKDPGYVGRAKATRRLEEERQEGSSALLGDLARLTGLSLAPESTGIGSVLFAIKPGDGSAREQAASCQRVLGGWANIAREYATKRYRANLCNWGILPFLSDESMTIGQRIVVPEIRDAVARGVVRVPALLLEAGGAMRSITLDLPLSASERPVLLAGCLINFYAGR